MREVQVAVSRAVVAKLGGIRARRPWWVAGLAAAAMLLPQVTTTDAVRADTASIQEYPVPNPLPRIFWNSPDAIVLGPDGNLWFTEFSRQKVSRITPAGVVTQFPVVGSPSGITVGPDGNLWFLEAPEQLVGRMSPDGTVLDQFPVPWLFYPQGDIQGITTGPDGNVWISDAANDKVGWIDMTGVLTEYTVEGGPFALTPGPDGNLWFTEWFSDEIGVLDPATGTVLAEYPVPPSSVEGNRTGLADITTGPDGNLWFTEQFEHKVGRITPEGGLMLFPLIGNAQPVGITVGPDGNLWVAESGANRIGRITPAGDVTEIHVPTARSHPLDIATGPDGHLWFTEKWASQIGRLDPATVTPPPPPCLVLTQSLTLTDDVGPCPGAGIVVTADNVTLDLNGHKVISAPGPRYGDFPGVLLLHASGVTVTNGTVTGFDAGVAVEGGSDNTLTRLNVHHNQSRADPASIYGDGIVLFHSSRNQIVDNVVSRNGIYDGIGVLGLDSNDNVIRGNRVTHNVDKGYAGPEGEGTGIIFNPFLELSNPRRGESLLRNNVIDNLVRDNVGSGISSLSNVGGVIRGNTVEHNGFRSGGRQGNEPGNGIGVQANFAATQSTRNFIESNRVAGNFAAGIQVFSNDNRIVRNTIVSNGAMGLELWGGQSNHVLNNSSTGNGWSDLFDASEDCDANVWRGNLWSGDTFPPCTRAGGHQVPAPAGPAGTAVRLGPAPRAQEPPLMIRGHRTLPGG
ncbi:MAG: virginiamycin B lyase family protein [Acidimicrobiales bacterium]